MFFGRVRAWTWVSSCISGSSMVRRPAVSKITTSRFSAMAWRIASAHRSGGLMSGRWKTGTPMRSPRTFNWSTAAGR